MATAKSTEQGVIDHLAMAKEDLAIAESGDSKREAYKRAAEHIASAVSDGTTQAVVATTIGKSREFVKAILSWRESGYEAATPWLADTEATGRAALSHTRKTLREKPEEVAAEIAEAMQTAEVRQAVAQHMPGWTADDLAERTRQRDPAPNTDDLRRKSKEREEFERKNKSGYLTWGEVESKTRLAKRLLAEVVTILNDSGHNLTPDMREFLSDDLDKLQAAINYARAAVTGDLDIDWDAEFARLTERRS